MSKQVNASEKSASELEKQILEEEQPKTETSIDTDQTAEKVADASKTEKTEKRPIKPTDVSNFEVSLSNQKKEIDKLRAYLTPYPGTYFQRFQKLKESQRDSIEKRLCIAEKDFPCPNGFFPMIKEDLKDV